MKYRAAILISLVALLLTTLSACLPSASVISLSQAIALSKTRNIASVTLKPDNGTMLIIAEVDGLPLQLTDAAGNAIQVSNGMTLSADIDGMNIADLQALGFVLPPQYSTTASSGGWSSLLIYLPILFLLILFIALMRPGRGGVQNQAFNFGRSRARLTAVGAPGVTFADVAGVEEAKQDLQEVVDFLKSRDKFLRLGARIPKGVLLVGPPGTGKTLLARAVAGEAGVPFFSISGSEFVELFVGVGASRVRDLFDQAKRSKPCIIFIDEIDAVGRVRGAGVASAHEEREQTLNQILTEMDGFDPNAGVIVLAATNRPDVLDPALLRPGRFDRRVTLERPDIGGRIAILKVHMKGKPLDETINLDIIAKETHGFSGADLSNMVNEAAILAARRDRQTIGIKEFEEAIDRIIAGPERKSLKIDPRDKEITAYHEAGHALVAHLLPHADPVHKISIVARGAMGGYTRLLTEDRYLMTRLQLNDSLATFLAGHTAEQMIFGDISTGPHSDLKQATELARRMVMEWGMGDGLVLRSFGRAEDTAYPTVGNKEYSEEVARQVDGEIHKILDGAHNVARKVLTENRDRLMHLSQKLLEVETLEGAELEKAFSEPVGNTTSTSVNTNTENASTKKIQS